MSKKMITYCFSENDIKNLPFNYYQIQKEIFEMFLNKELTETAFKIYMLIFDRTKISAENDYFQAENGALFVRYTYSQLKERLQVTDTPIAKALQILEDKHLIVRKQNFDNATDIYIKYIKVT